MVSIFTDFLSWTYVSRGPLVYVLQESSDVPSDVDDPLGTDSYHGLSDIIHDELLARLSINRPI